MKWIETIIIYAGHWLMHDYSWTELLNQNLI
jgi:hypothetical protein